MLKIFNEMNGQLSKNKFLILVRICDLGVMILYGHAMSEFFLFFFYLALYEYS
jgi:hypothetical protein